MNTNYNFTSTTSYKINSNSNIPITTNPFNYNRQVIQGSEVPTVEEKILKSNVEIFK